MIKKAKKSDISWMVNLSHSKRESYSKIQKHFWKMAENSDEIQMKWFEELLEMQDIIALVAENQKGFVIGKIITPPEVYDAGLTLMIDDFCVAHEDLWLNIGHDLIDKIKKIAASRNIKQILVVCGAHDISKKSLLKQLGLNVASQWYVGELDNIAI